MITTIEIILISLIFIVLALNLFLFHHLFKLKKRISVFFKGKKGKDLEEIISNQITESEEQKKEIINILRRIEDLEKRSKISFQKMGMKRFNPFDEVGGDQSFTLTLLNDKNDGFVVSSLYNKEGSRVYAKKIKEGKSKYSLTEEETEVISKAIENI